MHATCNASGPTRTSETPRQNPANNTQPYAKHSRYETKLVQLFRIPISPYTGGGIYSFAMVRPADMLP
jgi:hypothetical protein